MKITRAFSKKVQLKQFEPIDIFCSVEAECEEKEAFKVSANLDEFVRQEVETTLAIIRPPLKSVDPKATKKKNKEVSREEAENDFGQDAQEIQL